MPPVVLLALLIGLLIFVSWMKRAPAPTRERVTKRLLVGGGAALVVFLTVTGRLNWIFAAIGAAVPLALRLLQMVQTSRLLGGLRSGRTEARGASRQQTSQIETRFLRIRLDHDTGAMSGEVREGRFRGQTLESLEMDDLLELLAECRAGEAQSAAVLEAYLERTFGDAWREHSEQRRREAPGSRTAGGPMTPDEAYEILGLEAGAQRTEIVAAHRRLMQKLHPDRGGSTYLAAKINQAKDLLLEGVTSR